MPPPGLKTRRHKQPPTLQLQTCRPETSHWVSHQGSPNAWAVCSMGSLHNPYGRRTGLVGYPIVVNTQHPVSCLKFVSFLSFFLPFFSLYHFIGPCRPQKVQQNLRVSFLLSPFLLIVPLYRTLQTPKSAAKSPSSFLLIGRWLPNPRMKKKKKAQSDPDKQAECFPLN